MPRLVAASGLFATVAIIAGLIVSVAAGRAEVTLASTASQVAAALDAPAAGGVWIGLGLETLGLLAIVVFGAGLASQLTGWTSHAVGGAAVTFSAVSLVAMAAVALYERQAGTGLDPETARAFVGLAGLLYAATWVAGGLLVALAGTAFGRGLRWSAAAIAVLSFMALAAPASETAQLPAFLQLLWIATASVALLWPRATVAVARQSGSPA
jgi:hypothetical protein